MALYIMLQTSWQDTSAVLEIERTANLAMERMARGFKSGSDAAPRGLLDAKSFVIEGGSNIKFVSGIDLKERSFYLESGRLMYDPDTSAGSDEKPLLNSISALVFTADAGNPAKAVLISLTVSKSVKGIDRTMSLSSMVFLRNA